jgi:carbonic anhydrase
MIPVSGEDGLSSADESEAAAIEFALENLKVSDIIICGHSECGAMKALLEGRQNVSFPNLRAWLRHGEGALALADKPPAGLSAINYLSRLNALVQLQHLKTYAPVRRAIEQGRLRLHAWWFELSTANVYAYEEDISDYVLIDEAEADRIRLRLSSASTGSGS